MEITIAENLQNKGLLGLLEFQGLQIWGLRGRWGRRGRRVLLDRFKDRRDPQGRLPWALLVLVLLGQQDLQDRQEVQDLQELRELQEVQVRLLELQVMQDLRLGD